MVREGIEYDKKISKDAVKVAIDRVIPFLLLTLQKFMNFNFILVTCYLHLAQETSQSLGAEVEKKVTARYLESIDSKVSALLLLVANIRQNVSLGHSSNRTGGGYTAIQKHFMMSYWVHSQIWVCNR